RQATDQFFADLAGWLQARPGGTGRVREPNVVPDALSEELVKLASHIDRLAKGIESEEEKIELTAVADRCAATAEAVRQWLGQALDGQVYWLEARGERRQRLALASAPVEVGPALREQLFDKVPTVVLTSATLSAGGPVGFRHAQRRLGLDGCRAE